jgi:hypothetical protein
MVVEKYSSEMLENIIEDSELPNKGAYTNIGNYDPLELSRLISNLSKRTKISSDDIQLSYGIYLFKKLRISYTKYFFSIKDSFDFLKKFDSIFKIEILKLYFDKNLPQFNYHAISPTCITFEYHSNNFFEKLVEGLILGAAESFNEKITIQSEKLPPNKDKANNVIFTITKQEK